MKNKTGFLALLGLGLCVATSCVAYKVNQVKLDSMATWNRSEGEIFAIQKKSGERVDFSHKKPAVIAKETVAGMALQTAEIDKKEISAFIAGYDGKIIEMKTINGAKFPVHWAKIEGDKVRYVAPDNPAYPVSVDLKEIDLFWIKIKSVDFGGTLMLGAVIAIPIFIFIWELAQPRHWYWPGYWGRVIIR